jgi:stress-induced-phosphoprotein 1
MSGFKDQGNDAFKQKKFAEAIEFYSKALEATPTEHTILGNRAAAFHNLGKYQEAQADAEKCIEIKPDWSKGFQRKAMAQ